MSNDEAQAREAVQTLLRWIGEDPEREGLVDTPRRVLGAFKDYFEGYTLDPHKYMQRTFAEVGGYHDIVLLKDVPFVSHCEHHIAPFVGKAHVAYLPKDKVVGISKLARVVYAYSRRLQVQERLTAQIADCICDGLEPLGVAVVVEAQHSCMTLRGVETPGVSMKTSRMMGCFRDDMKSREEVLKLMGY